MRESCNQCFIKKKKKKKEKKRLSWLTTILSPYSVQSVSNFRLHLHCIVDKKMNFSYLKTNTSDQLFRNKLMSRTCEPREGLIRHKLGIRGYPALTLFGDHTYGPRLKPVCNDRRISLSSKLRLMRSLVTFNFLYARESWTLTAELQRRYESGKLSVTARY